MLASWRSSTLFAIDGIDPCADAVGGVDSAIDGLGQAALNTLAQSLAADELDGPPTGPEDDFVDVARCDGT